MDFDQIERFSRISLKSREDAVFSIPMTDVFDEGRLATLLDAYMTSLKTSDLRVAAVSFCRWYAFLAVGVQYFMSVDNVDVDLSLANIGVEMYPTTYGYWFSFPVRKWSTEPGPENPVEREAWKRQVISEFYGDTVKPMLEVLSEVTGAGIGQLWGQFPSRLIWFAGTLSASWDVCVRQRIAQDYEYLQNCPADIFGRKRNPFSVNLRWIESMEDPNKQVYVFPACCLNYARQSGEHCYACPHLTEEQRAGRRQKFRATQDVSLKSQ